jgi:hypothetical protein
MCGLLQTISGNWQEKVPVGKVPLFPSSFQIQKKFILINTHTINFYVEHVYIKLTFWVWSENKMCGRAIESLNHRPSLP